MIRATCDMMESCDIIGPYKTIVYEVKLHFIPSLAYLENLADSLQLLIQRKFDWSDRKMPGVVIGDGYYSIPIVALARTFYGVLTVLVYQCIQIVRVITRAISESVSSTGYSTAESPRGRGAGHYILDLMPENDRERRRTRSYFIGGGYSIPTIALANIIQLVMTTLTELSSKCVHGGLQMVLLTVLGAMQLQVGPSDDKEAGGEPPDTVVQNHYIFDLRPQYGSDIIEMFHNVLKNNWPTTLAHFRKYHKRSKRKFVFMSGWRPKLVNLEHKKRSRPKKNSLQLTKSTNHQHSKRMESSLFHSIGDVLHLEETLDIELPIKATDQDTDIEVPKFTRHIYDMIT